jgi:hypothetical protein
MVKCKDSTVIVSKNKPVVVYFNRAVKLLEKQILVQENESPIRIELAACGGAIPRCQQLARYVTQLLNDKYRHLVVNVSKSTATKKASVSVTDSVHSGAKFTEENAFDIISAERLIDQVIIEISARRL